MKRLLTLLKNKKVLVLVLIVITASVGLATWKYKLIQREQLSEKIFIIVEEGQSELTEDEVKDVISKSLQPEFLTYLPTKAEKDEFRFYIDDFNNDLVHDPLFDEEKGKREWVNGNALRIKLPYLLFPKTHKLRIESGEFEKEASFNLIFYDDLSEDVHQSPFWSVPSIKIDYRKYWVTEEEMLKALPHPGTFQTSDLTFLRKFPANVFLGLELTPLTERVNLAIFFGDEISLMLGDGDNKTIRLKQRIGYKDEVIEEGVFLLESRKTYYILADRREGQFRLYIKEKDLEKTIPAYSIADENNLLVEASFKPRQKIQILGAEGKFDNIVFSLWRNSGGVAIDNIYISETLPGLSRTE